jgi:hypothetical protein
VRIDFDNIPVVDTHAHPFPREQGAVSWGFLRDVLSISLRGQTTDDNDSMLIVSMFGKQLGRLLDCRAELEAIMEARNVLAVDPAGSSALVV